MINDYEKAGIVSFVYNVGYRTFMESSLFKLVKIKASATLIDVAFRAYNKGRVNGELIVLKGLDYRRTTESLLYNKQILKFYN
jgi:GH24 family phage-related lysozyme (muramidase)